ncbi:egg cell-secreted protein 1.5-like [Bidens hawaiensis]|uniref:egg cell-secreted protein 1.5-like n=1 Tax=Bidens hawaiensis TaxID=980011 RepID=UPI00404AC540
MLKNLFCPYLLCFVVVPYVDYIVNYLKLKRLNLPISCMLYIILIIHLLDALYIYTMHIVSHVVHYNPINITIMASIRALPITLLLTSLVTLQVCSTARKMHHEEGRVVRLQGEKDSGGLVDCWNALLELNSCTNEIVLFFVNGETYLSIDCCRAIRTITYGCWPSMLTSLGFTSEEGDVLQGYCGGAPLPQPVMIKGPST